MALSHASESTGSHSSGARTSTCNPSTEYSTAIAPGSRPSRYAFTPSAYAWSASRVLCSSSAHSCSATRRHPNVRITLSAASASSFSPTSSDRRPDVTWRR